MIIKRFDDNHGICIHLLKSLINFYSLGYKNYLNSEIVLFFSKNYYFRFFFEWFFSLRELFRLDSSLNSIRLSLLGIRFGINFEKAESVRKDYYYIDDYIQFHIDSGTIRINDEETSVVDDNGEKPLVSKEYFVSKYLKVYNSDFLNHKFDLIVEINLFKTYPMKINFGQSLFYSDEWLGCHIDINLRNDFPNIDLYLCGCKRELSFTARKMVEDPREFSFEESYPEQIDEHGFLFQKLNLQTLKQINPNDIMFVAATVPGGMGFAKTARFFVVEDNEIKQYFIELLNNEIVEEVQTIFSPITKIYPWTGGLDEEFFEKWRRIGMGVGNKLIVRKEFYDEVKKELLGEENRNTLPYIYTHWCQVAHQTLLNVLTEKEK
jgi:hypothetical protein